MNDITIDPEFEGIIRPLSSAETAALEKSLLEEGCHTPLVVWRHNGIDVLVDGHNRLRLCTQHQIDFKTTIKEFDCRDDARCWIIDNQMARRNLSRFSMVELQLLKEPILRRLAKENQRESRGRGKRGLTKSGNLKSVHVDKEIGAASGTSRDTVRKVRLLLAHAREGVIQKLHDGKVSINAAHRLVRMEIEQEKRRIGITRDAEAFAQSHPDEDFGILHGDFREVAEGIEDESVSLILVDPPYGRAAAPIYAELGAIAARILRPRGSLLVYTGQANLADAVIGISPSVRYFWTFACRHEPGHDPRLLHYNVINRWKPVLWFHRGKRSTKSRFLADLVEGRKEKEHHDWQQSLEEAEYLIEHMTQPGDLVVDLFCGSGTVPLAARKLSRRWLGCDSDMTAVQTARRRISPEICNS